MSANVSVYEKQLIREIEGMPEEYLLNLLKIVRLFRESVLLKPAKAGFGQGWGEMLAGETEPISKLWDGIDAK